MGSEKKKFGKKQWIINIFAIVAAMALFAFNSFKQNGEVNYIVIGITFSILLVTIFFVSKHINK